MSATADNAVVESAGLDIETASERYQRLKKDPLCHPGVFARECFTHQFEVPPHLGELYHAVWHGADEEVEGYTRLARLMPREHGKSEAGAVVTPVWKDLEDPNTRILLMSQTDTQARRKLRECRDHLKRLAPQFGRTVVEDNKSEVTLERSAAHDVATITAAGFNSGVTGGHFDVIIFDDIVDWASQRTAARRDKIWQQFQDYLNLGSRGQSLFVVLGTRKHSKDIYSELIEGPAWNTKVRAAIDDWSLVENKEFSVVTQSGKRYHASNIADIDGSVETIKRVEPHRDVRVLWPERWPLDALLFDLISGYGASQGSLIWRRENQNDATVFQGEILSAEMLTFAEQIPAGPRNCTWVAGLDPAVEDDPEKAATNNTDYWSLAIGAYSRHDDTTYVDKVIRRRGLTMGQGLSWVAQHLSAYQNVDISKVLVEDQQAQRWFVQEGKEKGLPLERSTSSGAKEDRIIDMSARFESGKVKLLEESGESAESWESFVDEWCAFPSGDHDDRLDAVEILLRASGSQSTGGFEIYSY